MVDPLSRIVEREEPKSVLNNPTYRDRRRNSTLKIIRKRLYEWLNKQGNNPFSELGALSQEVLIKGIIDWRRYIVLQYRTPFPRIKMISLEGLGQKLGVANQKVSQLELDAYKKVLGYIENQRRIY
ncbi:hypothetical protein HYX08_02505 [Candidatus Woesearchaeota archaeon]|nr:hypothetical protein [Candidatus Woesearchaeota archaeon]